MLCEYAIAITAYSVYLSIFPSINMDAHGMDIVPITYLVVNSQQYYSIYVQVRTDV